MLGNKVDGYVGEDGRYLYRPAEAYMQGEKVGKRACARVDNEIGPTPSRHLVILPSHSHQFFSLDDFTPDIKFCVFDPCVFTPFDTRLPDMIDTRHLRCKDEQCTKQPSFGMEVRHTNKKAPSRTSSLLLSRCEKLSVHVRYFQFCQSVARTPKMMNACTEI